MKIKINVEKLPEVPNICNQILREVWKSENVSVAHVIMKKGNTSLLHKHKLFTELYYILSGRGILWLDKRRIKVDTGILVEIPPNIPHKLKNTGKSSLIHLVISTPSFNPKDVIIIGEKK